ncbi:MULTISPECIES: hypothetical protein [Bacillaceae]|uniref:hypothetical protein n=1 Tax=Bacillaceae TaxID=186817 RepID=UPI000660BAA6|nr:MULTISPECIES: hypothetical protein [Bacillaceae]MCF7620915.1 hypothetical protein [Peribacillus frigoritolerans]PRA87634.1 hypothetical protein CQ056_14265 [Peribacillus simplex]
MERVISDNVKKDNCRGHIKQNIDSIKDLKRLELAKELVARLFEEEMQEIMIEDLLKMTKDNGGIK